MEKVRFRIQASPKNLLYFKVDKQENVLVEVMAPAWMARFLLNTNGI